MKKINVRSPYYIEVAPKPTQYYALQKCEDSSIGYITEQSIGEIALDVDDRVQDSSTNDYIVVGTAETGTSVGIVTDTGEVGCFVPPAPLYYSLTRCSDSITGFISAQEVVSGLFNYGARVLDSNNVYYTISGVSETGTSVGTITNTGQYNCPVLEDIIDVNCGDTHNVATDVGVVTYNFDTNETGNVSVDITGSDVPAKFTLKWNNTQSTTNYIGLDTYDQDLLDAGVPIGEIATGVTSTKADAFLEINKSASTPSLVQLVVTAPLINDQYSVVFNCPEPAPIVIEETTQINIWFDSSGSMDETLAPLQAMAAGTLKSCLIQFYDNDSAKYDQYVKVRSWSNERTFDRALQPPTEAGATNCINIIFQDEANSIYTPTNWTPSSLRTSAFNTDIIGLRNALLNNPTGYITPIFFQVQAGAYLDYKNFLKTVEFGATLGGGSNYDIPYNLSDLSDRVKFYYDVQDGVSYASNPDYYRDFIIQAINDLGFSITCAP
jgi:hypothetical protein